MDCRIKVTTAELAVAQNWDNGTRARGPVVAIRKFDLRRIRDIVNSRLLDDPADAPEVGAPIEGPADADEAAP